jgi:radical SAM superfamily enzyme YgiQ (UPF0313 family)
MFRIAMENENPMAPKRLCKPAGQSRDTEPSASPLTSRQFDELYEFPIPEPASSYDDAGVIPGLEEVRFSITSNRGCYGACSFCAITSHQGRMIQIRTKQSLVKEARTIAAHPDFKGYIHDLGGPTANFQEIACDRQSETGPCQGRQCLFPSVSESTGHP